MIKIVELVQLNTEIATSWKVKETIFKTCEFSIWDNNNFILFFPEDVYTYQYMDDWEKFDEISLPEKEDFKSLLNM